jgi:hypothetical protein
MSTLLKQVVQPQKYRTTFIYGLIDPRTEYVRYVGKANKPKVRLSLHLLPSQLKNKNHRTNWLRNILDSGNKPLLVILEEVKYGEWQNAEKKWIAHYRNLPNYPPLTNSTDGGDGVEGYVYTEEDRKKRSIAHTGIKMPLGTGKKISDANRGIPKSAEARAHFSEGQKNRWNKTSEEDKQKILRNLCYTPTIELRKEISKRARNAPRPENTASRYRNVIQDKQRGNKCWRAGCIINGKQICIGYFCTEEETARARDCYFLKYIGEDVILNFPRSNYPENPDDIVVEKNKRVYTQMKNKHNSSGYMGVTRNGPRLWTAAVSHLGIRYRLGTHKTKELAAQSYDRKVIELLGDKARTNFPRSQYD